MYDQVRDRYHEEMLVAHNQLVRKIAESRPQEEEKYNRLFQWIADFSAETDRRTNQKNVPPKLTIVAESKMASGKD